MQGSQAVIDALNNVLGHGMALHQQAHFQEHKFELMKYGFSQWWDKIETQAHDKLNHFTIDRIALLGGEPTPSWAFPIIVRTDVGGALDATLAALSKTHAAYRAACDVAEADDDYVTEKMIWCHLEHIEKWIGKFESRKAQYDRLGQTAFMAEFI